MEILTLTPLEAEALRLSLWVSCWAVAGSLPIGILTAWVLARRDFPCKTLLDGLIHLPLVLPPVVVGYLLLVLLGRKGIVGEALHSTLGISFAFNWKGAAVASAVVSFPLL
ncbi:MAG: molybdate ABC transporter permease subunit, partial [Pseudomonadota bacterium]